MKLSASSRLWWAIIGLMAGACPPAAQAQLITLGAAANYAGLTLGTGTFTISKNSTLVTGNAGIAANGSLDFSGGALINGTIYAGAGATLTLTGGSSASGGIVQPYAGLAQAVADANAAASYYAGLTPTQTLATLGAGTLLGNGGLNVFNVTGSLALANTSLTLSGGAADTFVFNIHGGANTIGGGASIVLNGISPAQVLFNLIGGGTQLTTTGHSDTQGIFLAANGAMDIQGGTHISDFIAGSTLIWQSGVQVTQATTLTPVPELGQWPVAIFSLTLLGLLAWRREKSRKGRTADIDASVY